jgi:hypothetical protein
MLHEYFKIRYKRSDFFDSFIMVYTKNTGCGIGRQMKNYDLYYKGFNIFFALPFLIQYDMPINISIP